MEKILVTSAQQLMVGGNGGIFSLCKKTLLLVKISVAPVDDASNRREQLTPVIE